MRDTELTHWHTPVGHAKHSPSIPCACSTKREDDLLICPCGAAYTKDVEQHPRFFCVDCGKLLRDA